TYLALTFLFALFLLLQHSDLRDRVVRVAGTDNMTETTSAMSEAGERLSQLFLMQAALNAGFGLVVAIALAVIGLPNAMLWGVVAALMRFVPFIGSLLAAVPPMLLAAAVDPGWGMFIATVLVFAIGEPVMGHVVEPLVLGKRAGLSPFAMVIAASFWALVWGPVGLILAAPLTMSLVVLGRYISGLEFFTVLLGDEPALSPQETFYHRLLSDDSISAAQQLEDVADEGTAFDVSDGVVLPALHLATMDQRRGRFDREGLSELRDTMGSVIGLVTEPASDKAPAASGAQQDVLVVPARGMIDTAAADFVAAMLQRIPSLAPRASGGTSGLTALSDARTAIDKDELETLVLVTVGGIEPQQLQFIVRRAMRDFPTTRILVLDWGRGLSARRASDRNSDIAVPVAATYRDLTDALQLRMAKESAPAKPVRALDALQAV
ncbi:MAG: AI-2E family transporter, partial [Hyphomicrobium sp.]